MHPRMFFFLPSAARPFSTSNFVFFFCQETLIFPSYPMMLARLSTGYHWKQMKVSVLKKWNAYRRRGHYPFFFSKCLPFFLWRKNLKIWCNKAHSMPQILFTSFCTWCEFTEWRGWWSFGWFIGRSVGWPSIHKPTKNCMLYCFLVIKFLLVCMKKYTPLVRRSAPLFEQIFLFDSLMNS